jgi:glycosyltransferase involved in cell wall biosynthesis
VASFGHLPRRRDYIRVLWDSDVVVSTAIQEFFGIAVLEAAYCGALPLVPRRLVYPELYATDRLYDGDAELTTRLRAFIKGGVPRGPGLAELQRDLRSRSTRELVAAWMR